jgi:SNF2 family DNA or RNA helicase
VPDPRQRTLPHALQFDPGSVLPDADDGRDIPDGSRYFTHGNDIGPELRKALVRHADVSSDLDNGWKLFSHQKRAVLFALRQRRSILALDMGTGKTLIGCVWARAFFRAFRGDCQVVVICPVSLKSNWERTAAEATGLLVASPNPSVIIASWASVPAQLRGGIAEESTEGDSDCSDVVAAFSRCQSRRRPFKYYVVVADEAHSMQSMAAKRTQQALQLMLDRRCVGALLLTGTPLKNGKPANLFPLLRAVKHPLASCQRAYEEHFCDGRYHSFGNKQPIWKAGGAQNLDQLRELASSHVLFLSKEDVLKGLPPQTRIKKRVPVSAQWQARHAKALHELSVAFDSSQDQLGGNSGVNSGTDKKNDDKAVLGALQRLRKVGSLAKADAAARLAAQVLEEEPAVVVFSSFVDVSASIHKQLGNIGWTGELLTGETPPHKRQDMVDRFQRGESAAFCCTFGAGGVGLTLTASATVILVDRPWTPGDAAQAEGATPPSEKWQTTLLKADVFCRFSHASISLVLTSYARPRPQDRPSEACHEHLDLCV